MTHHDISTGVWRVTNQLYSGTFMLLLCREGSDIDKWHSTFSQKEICRWVEMKKWETLGHGGGTTMNGYVCFGVMCATSEEIPFP